MDKETRDAIRDARAKYIRAMGYEKFKEWLHNIGLKLTDQEFIDRAEHAEKEVQK